MKRRTVRRSHAKRRILYHYTNRKGLKGILASHVLFASTAETSPKDIRYGEGQYVSDLLPGTKRPTQLARLFVKRPYAKNLYTHFVAIDVTDLRVIEGRKHVYVIPNTRPLDLRGRIVRSGRVRG